ncbi:MAG: sodium-dependent transporter [Bacteroidota bacterium]
MEQREQWGSRIGLILAMAGNAVGLGNFLRFPVQAAQNGGGAFMIPYFVAFILLAVPLMWVEWTIGRHGGKHNHGSLPGMFDVMWNHPVAKYIGVIGLFVSTIIVIYYTYVESWCLGFSFFTLTKEYFGMTDFETMAGFLHSYQGGGGPGHFDSFWPAYIFLIITMALNFYVLGRGISRGIEIFAKIAMPMLLLFGVALAVWVFTVGAPDPVNHPDRTVAKGFAFIWNPDFSLLSDSSIWLAAAGQVFFTLSVGMGTLQAYASYLPQDTDIALSGLATASINEFTEVVLGGTIAIPIAVAFFGLVQTQMIASGDAYDLGFVSMPVIFQQIPFGNLLGFMWFFLLFFAGITSSVAMAQPLISFLKEQFHLTHRKATWIIASLIFISVHFVMFYYQYGFLEEMDYWAGTFALVIVALVEVIVFAWIFGIDNGWRELTRGADIKVPRFFRHVIKYVTPAYLLFILIFWTWQEAIPTFMMEKVDPGEITYRWGSRAMMLAILITLLLMIRAGWKRNQNKNTHLYPEK